MKSSNFLQYFGKYEIKHMCARSLEDCFEDAILNDTRKIFIIVITCRSVIEHSNQSSSRHTARDLTS